MLGLCVKVVASISMADGLVDKRTAALVAENEPVALQFYTTGARINAATAYMVPAGFTRALQAYIVSNEAYMWDYDFAGYLPVRQLCAGLLGHIAATRGSNALQHLVAGAMWLSRMFLCDQGWRLPDDGQHRPENFAHSGVFMCLHHFSAGFGLGADIADRAAFVQGVLDKLQQLYGYPLAVIPSRLLVRRRLLAFPLSSMDLRACVDPSRQVRSFI